MKELIAKTGKNARRQKPRFVRWKLTAAAQRERKELIALGVYGSDYESNIMESTMSLDQEYSNHHHQKQAPMDSELIQWNRMDLKRSTAHFSSGSTSANQLLTGFLLSPSLL